MTKPTTRQDSFKEKCIEHLYERLKDGASFQVRSAMADLTSDFNINYDGWITYNKTQHCLAQAAFRLMARDGISTTAPCYGNDYTTTAVATARQRKSSHVTVSKQFATWNEHQLLRMQTAAKQHDATVGEMIYAGVL
jgi:hypothetical protein